MKYVFNQSLQMIQLRTSRLYNDLQTRFPCTAVWSKTRANEPWKLLLSLKA